MMIAMNLKIDQLTEKLLVLAISMEVGGLISTKPRTGSASGMNHTPTKFSKLNFPTFEGGKSCGLGVQVQGVFQIQ